MLLTASLKLVHPDIRTPVSVSYFIMILVMPLSMAYYEANYFSISKHPKLEFIHTLISKFWLILTIYSLTEKKP